MFYTVEITASATKQLRRLPKRDSNRLRQAVEQLQAGLTPSCRKLSGYANLYRLRVGVYRALFAMEHEKLRILVFQVGHRKEIYRSIQFP
ncbi:MAG: type II toxin-antitoxin system RelE/ParE family toxin [Myxococcota bacterium]